MNSVRDGDEDGECPDCGTPIPDDAEEETGCVECGHVFMLAGLDDELATGPYLTRFRAG